VFLRRQRRLADPLVDLALFARPGFSAALAINVLGFFAMFASFLYIAQYLQLVLGMDPLTAGLWTLPSSLGFIAGSFIVPLVAQRLGTLRVMVGGLVLSALGFVLLGFVGTTGLAMLVLGSVVFSVGLSPVVALTTNLVVSSAPPERAGSASSLSETSSELGGALGIAVLGTIAAAVYRASMINAIPGGAPQPVGDAARGTMGGARGVRLCHNSNSRQRMAWCRASVLRGLPAGGTWRPNTLDNCVTNASSNVATSCNNAVACAPTRVGPPETSRMRTCTVTSGQRAT